MKPFVAAQSARRRLFVLVAAGLLSTPAWAQSGAASSSSPSQSKDAQAAIAASSTLQGMLERGVVRLGVRDGAIPFAYQVQDNFVGYSVDLCMRVVESLRTDLKQPKLRIQWVPTKSVNQSLELLEKGQIDIECGATVNNATRRERVAFTVPHFFSIGRVLTKASSGAKVLADFSGKTIATSKGTTTTKRLQAMIDQKIGRYMLHEVETAKEGLALLEQGKVAGFANFEAQLYHWRSTQKNPTEFAIVGEAMAMEPVALVLPKNDPVFKKRIDIAVSHAMIDGHVSNMYKRWFLQPIPPQNAALGMPMSEALRSSLLFPTDKASDS